MKYHIKQPDHDVKIFGETYITTHPLYNSGTIFKIKDSAIVIIQQRFDTYTKNTYWGPIDNWLANAIYTNKDFLLLFEKYASGRVDGYYPTITVRHAMSWLKMKPLKKERWETVFDRSII